jgi:hypothetical protein
MIPPGSSAGRFDGVSVHHDLSVVPISTRPGVAGSALTYVKVP